MAFLRAHIKEIIKNGCINISAPRVGDEQSKLVSELAKPCLLE